MRGITKLMRGDTETRRFRGSTPYSSDKPCPTEARLIMVISRSRCPPHSDRELLLTVHPQPLIILFYVLCHVFFNLGEVYPPLGPRVRINFTNQWANRPQPFQFYRKTEDPYCCVYCLCLLSLDLIRNLPNSISRYMFRNISSCWHAWLSDHADISQLYLSS
jgi:hypothetical protein